MESPVLQSGRETWAPAGAAFIDGSVYFGGLRGQALFQAKLQGESAVLSIHFKEQFGRIRDIIVGPDGFLYISTSNRDGRGNPVEEDDKIIRLDPNQF